MCSSCVTLPCLYFNHQISTLANIIISQCQYNLGRNHLHSNSQVRIPSRIGCFHEINMLHYRWWGSTHTRPHCTRHQRKIAAASMWGHRRNTRHSGVWGLGPCMCKIHPWGSFLLLGWHHELQFPSAAPLTQPRTSFFCTYITYLCTFSLLCNLPLSIIPLFFLSSV